MSDDNVKTYDKLKTQCCEDHNNSSDNVNFTLKTDDKKSSTTEYKSEETLTFSSFIFSLASSALISMGEMPNPMNNQIEKDLVIAKQNIDLLDMLKIKTKNNLNKEEELLLEELLYNLRVKYLECCGKKS